MTAPVAELAGKFEERVAAFVKENRLPGAAAGIVVVLPATGSQSPLSLLITTRAR